MESNFNWQDRILDQIHEKTEFQDIEDSWTYENPCGPEYKSLVVNILLLLCKEPFKKQIMNVTKAVIDMNCEDLNIRGMAELYWAKFLISLRLTNMKVIAVNNLSDREEPTGNDQVNIWDLVLEHLRQLGMEPEALLIAMEIELPNSEDKELAKKILCRGFQLMIDAISDYALHDTYETVTGKVMEMVRKKHIRQLSPYLATMLKAKSYKLDEALTVAQFLADLGGNPGLIKDFFNVRGNSLPVLLSRALGLLGKFKESDTKK